MFMPLRVIFVGMNHSDGMLVLFLRGSVMIFVGMHVRSKQPEKNYLKSVGAFLGTERESWYATKASSVGHKLQST